MCSDGHMGQEEEEYISSLPEKKTINLLAVNFNCDEFSR